MVFSIGRLGNCTWFRVLGSGFGVRVRGSGLGSGSRVRVRVPGSVQGSGFAVNPPALALGEPHIRHMRPREGTWSPHPEPPNPEPRGANLGEPLIRIAQTFHRGSFRSKPRESDNECYVN